MTNEELAIKIHAGETELLPVLWDQIEKVVKMLAWRFYQTHRERCDSFGVSVDDLYQQGYFGFLESVKNYDDEQVATGYKFLTTSNIYFKKEFCAACKMHTKQWRNKIIPVSLETPVSEDDDELTLNDSISDPDAEAAFDNILKLDYLEGLRKDLNSALYKLEKRQWQVIEYLFFQGKSYKDTAEALNIGVRAVEKLRGDALFILAKNKYLREKYKDEIIERYGYGFGLQKFKNLGMSSQERAILILESKGLL